MSSDEYQVQNIFRYARKTHKKKKSAVENDISYVVNDVTELNESPRSNVRSEGLVSPGCSCELDTEGEIANILHKKCPVINLAQQQLRRLLSETDNLLCDNTRCCRSVYDFIWICKDILFSGKQKCRCLVLVLITIGFLLGMIVGAASCGKHLRKFNSPILHCIDNYFLPDFYSNALDTHRYIT